MEGTITLNNAQDQQVQLKYAVNKISSFTRLHHQNKKDGKGLT